VPRLTRSQYFIRHGLLSYLWETHRQLFSLLSSTAQLELHRFFLPTVDIQEHELASYRDYINEREPSLAHKAGKHFKEFTRPRPEVEEIIMRGKPVVVRPIMKPEPDLQKLARAFVNLAEHQLRGDDCNTENKSS
jgi:hypothetical protein